MHKAVRIHGKGDLRVDTLPIPEPKEGEVQLKMACGGLCHTDVTIYDGAQLDQVVINKPMILGHEVSGTVSKLGPGVTDVKVGDRVAVDPVQSCSNCRPCKKQRGNICESLKAIGVIQSDGGFANYTTFPAQNCYKLPDHVTLEEGALLEPLSVVVNAIRRAKIEQGDNVIVSGAGPVGLFAMQVAKALGAGKVMVVDPIESRLQLAAKLGADVTFSPLKTSDPEEAGEALKRAFGDCADLCVECSGAKGTVDAAIFACRHGGKVMMVGIGDMKMEVHLGTAAFREIDIMGSLANLNNYPECVELVSSGKVDVKSAITHRLPLEDVLQGMELIRSGQSVKVIIDCSS